MTACGKMILVLVAIYAAIATVVVYVFNLTNLKMIMLMIWILLIIIIIACIHMTKKIYKQYKNEVMKFKEFYKKDDNEVKKLIAMGEYYIAYGAFGKEKTEEIRKMVEELNNLLNWTKGLL